MPGDYLYRDSTVQGYQGGTWGVFRVAEPSTDGVIVRTGPSPNGRTVVLSGAVTRKAGGAFAKEVTVTVGGQPFGKAAVDPNTGARALAQAVPAANATKAAQRIEIASGGGGRRVPLAPLAAPRGAVPPPAAVPALAAERAQ